MVRSNSLSRQRRRLCVLLAATAIVSPAVTLGVTFTDTVGDNYGPTYVDIASVDVTSDATNLTFQINLNPSANLLAEDGSQVYGKYQIGFQTGEAGNTAIANPYGNAIGISSGTGMDYWVGSWANNSATPPFSGSAGLFQYTGATATQVAGVGYSGTPFIDVPVTLAATSTTIVVPLAQLGLAAGDTFKFDVWTTFDNPAGQSAYDALGNPGQTTAPGTPYAPVTPYDSGTTLLTYTIGGPSAVDANWAGNTDANWSTGSNWSGGIAPNGVGHAATFGTAIGAPQTVTIDGAKTVGILNFNNANAYTLAGSGLTVDGTAGGAINVVAGSHFIDSAVTLADDTTITIAPAASTLAFRGTLTATGRMIAKAGAGTATFVNVRSASLHVQAGTVRTPAQAAGLSAAGTSVLNSLTIEADAQFDLTNNAMVLDYTGTAVTQDVRAMLQSGRLVATGLPSAAHRIGYVDNAVGTARTTFGGLNIDASSVLIAYTLGGDTNLDRIVNFDDLVSLAQNYGIATGATWQRGDLNYDAAVNFDDLVIVAQNYNGSASIGESAFGTTFAADWSLAMSLVPEPTSLGIAAIGFAISGRRCRR